MQKKEKTEKQSRKVPLVFGIIIAIAFCVSIYAYAILPSTIAIHWGLSGEANGFSEKSVGLLLVPLLMLGLAGLFFIIPVIDPLRNNISQFRKEYDFLVAILLSFLLYVHIATILLNLGISLNLLQLLSPAFAVLLWVLGILLGKSKRNYFIGIRTPWTLASDTNWEKTNTLGGKLFKLCGLISLIGLFVPSLAVFLFLIPLVLSSIFLIVYSYFIFEKETK